MNRGKMKLAKGNWYRWWWYTISSMAMSVKACETEMCENDVSLRFYGIVYGVCYITHVVPGFLGCHIIVFPLSIHTHIQQFIYIPLHVRTHGHRQRQRRNTGETNREKEQQQRQQHVYLSIDYPPYHSSNALVRWIRVKFSHNQMICKNKMERFYILPWL